MHQAVNRAQLRLCDLSSTSSSEQPQRNGGQPGFVLHRRGPICSSKILEPLHLALLTILRGRTGCQPGTFSFPYLNRKGAARVFNDGCHCHLAKTQLNPQTVDLPTFSTFLVVVKYVRALVWDWTQNRFQSRLAAGVFHLHMQFL